MPILPSSQIVNIRPVLAVGRIHASLQNGRWPTAITIIGMDWILILIFCTSGSPSCIACWLPTEPCIFTWIGTRTAYARLLLDELFGADHLLNEIIWTYHGPSPIRRAFNRKHDTILVYVKSGDYIFNVDAVREPYNENTVKTFHASPKAGFGKVPDLERGKVPEDWWYFPVIARLHSERTGYPTQKPVALLERIVLASSNPGDLVADFFCGSGTTPFVAARHGRRFIACDEMFRALHTTRSRLTDLQAPFSLERDATFTIADHACSPVGESSKFQKESICLNTDLDLDYWEVDPHWDGNSFPQRSAGQTVHTKRRDPA